MTGCKWSQLDTVGYKMVQSNPINTDTEGTIESVRINRVSLWTKQTVGNNEVSILGGCP